MYDFVGGWGPVIWSKDQLWPKSKLFMARALAEDREGVVFPLWATLSLEMLARASVAKVSPALLADPREGQNLMFAFGYGAAKSPKSVEAKTVFQRCQQIVPNFTEKETGFCLSMAERRNGELHSGLSAFDAFPTGAWLAEFYRVSGLLLSHLGETLESFVGAAEGAAATEMVTALENDLQTEVRNLLAEKARLFALLGAPDQEKHRKEGESGASGVTNPFKKVVECPACRSKAVIAGKVVRAGSTEFDETEELVIREVVLLPTDFQCYSCGLVLKGHDRLHAGDMGGQYTVTEAWDLSQYQVDEPEPDYSDLYGND